jgi:hypothetical protein
MVTCRLDPEHIKSVQKFTDGSNARLQLSSRLMCDGAGFNRYSARNRRYDRVHMNGLELTVSPRFPGKFELLTTISAMSGLNRHFEFDTRATRHGLPAGVDSGM